MMLNWPIIILCAVGISILLTLIVIPQILHVSQVKQLFDRPNDRKIHQGVVPRLGGLAFLPVIFVTLGIMMVIPASISPTYALSFVPDFTYSLPDVMVLLAAMIIMFVTGLFDDLMGVKYEIKFIAQIIAAVLLVEAGCFIVDYWGLFGIFSTHLVIGKVITGFLIIYIINSLNLIDGIDGLAAGLTVVALCFYGFVLFGLGQFIFSLLAWVGAASMAVFWVFNVFGSQKKGTKIFMGDIGSLTMGVLVAFLAIAISRQDSLFSDWEAEPLVLALSPLVLPLFDVIRVFCVRLSHGKSPFLPDKRHIHHLLLEMGIPMKLAMVLLILSQIAFMAINLFMSGLLGINWILLVDLGLYMIFIVFLQALEPQVKAKAKN